MLDKRKRFLIVSALSFVLLAPMLWHLIRPRFSAEDVAQRVYTAIQSEAPESFLVTGALTLTATTTVDNTKRLFPGVLDINLGTSTATVQIPAEALYGFDVRELKQEDIRIRGDTVEMQVPIPTVRSVAPNLAELRVHTTQGWLRTPASVQSAQAAAIRSAQPALEQQARNYVATSTQPQVNTANALAGMMRPILQSAGLQNPVFRFRVGRTITIEQ